MTRTDYERYLQSPHWRRIRAAAIARAQHRCTWCRKRRRLEVHHLTYRRLGREHDNDLLVLCGYCHEMTHGLLPKRPKYGDGPTRGPETIPPETMLERNIRKIEQL